MNSPIIDAINRALGKVLVVEDEANAWVGVKRELEKRGMQVTIAQTAQDASRRLREQRYDAIVLDLLLPAGAPSAPKGDEDSIGSTYLGIALFEELRRGAFADQGTSSTVPVFVVTGVDNPHAKDRVDRLKPEYHFVKPLAPFVIAEHVKLHLEDLPHGK
jgi:CheY-like chemotaxis protein